MDACRQKLQFGLTSLGLSLTEAQIAALLDFVQLMAKWNKTYNLTAVRQPEEMVAYHILDSLAVLPYVKPPQIVDVGAGPGLPGIPLAICLPECQFTLIDSNAKKTRFIRQAILELKLANVEVVHARVEAFQSQQLFSSVICRAFAAIPDILTLTGHLLMVDGVWLAMKGKRPDQELSGLNMDYQVACLQAPGVDGERCLVILEKQKHD